MLDFHVYTYTYGFPCYVCSNDPKHFYREPQVYIYGHYYAHNEWSIVKAIYQKLIICITLPLNPIE